MSKKTAALTPLYDDDAILEKAAIALESLPFYARHYTHWKLRLDPMYPLLAREERHWGRVLDAGCGHGILAAISWARGDTSSYMGVDRSPRKLKAAARLLTKLGHPAMCTEQLNLPADPLPQGPYDTTLLLDVLHYWPRPTQALILTQIHETMITQGTLYLREGISKEGSGSAGMVGWGERFTTLTGQNPFTSELHFLQRHDMTSLLRDCGFEVLTTTPTGSVNELWRCRAK